MKQPDFKGRISTNVPLSRLSTWRIGGPADWVVEADTEAEIEAFLRQVRLCSIPWIVIGNGSNILFSDRGFRGAILLLGTGFKSVSIEQSSVRAGAGIHLSHLANTVADAGLSGFEPLAGIPGTAGGAAFVNAGAYGCSMLHMCDRIMGFGPTGEYRSFDEIKPEYRSGGFPDGCVITEILLTLTPSDPPRIHEQMSKYLEQRRSTQPLSEASAGCTFKNPEGTGAGRLIDGLGLKGFQTGRAMISTKHANFIINSGGASASDVIDVIRHVRQRILEAHGIRLQLEVLVLDEWGTHTDPGGECK